jgi:magnesium transporter
MARIFGAMAHDERADLFAELTEEQKNALLPGLAQAEREDMRKLAAYPEGTVGSVMTSDYATLSPAMKVTEAIAHLRHVAPDSETIYHSYVVDEERKLLGTVALRDLIVARDTATVAEIMRREPPFIRAEDPREEAVELIRRYDVLALPVINGGDRLAGIVTYDDAMDVAQEVTRPNASPRPRPSRGWAARCSTPRPGFSTASASRGSDPGLRQHLLGRRHRVLRGNDRGACGAGVLPAAADRLGRQRRLAIGDADGAGAGHRRRAHVRLGPDAGPRAGVAGRLARRWRWRSRPSASCAAGPDIALVVSLTMVLIVIVGSLIGMLLPFLLSKFKFDPATASAPLVTSIADATGVLIYFAMATWILGMAAA